MKTQFVFGLALMGLGSVLVGLSTTIGVGLIVLSQSQGGLDLPPVSYFGGFTIAQVIPGAFAIGGVLVLVGWKVAEVAHEERNAPIREAQAGSALRSSLRAD